MEIQRETIKRQVEREGYTVKERDSERERVGERMTVAKLSTCNGCQNRHKI